MNENEIWVIDEDHDEHEILRETVRDLGIKHGLRFFDDSKEFLAALGKEDQAPFVILCSVRLAGFDGFNVRKHLLKKSSKKFHSVPFIFMSVHASEDEVNKAYKNYAHGYFVKPDSIGEWREIVKLIIDYWSRCKLPSKQDVFQAPLK